MRRSTADLAVRTGFLVFLLFSATVSTTLARPKDLEVRGTLLCRADGDARRERPTDPRGIVVEPVGISANTEMLGEAGLFRIRVPYELVDHELMLNIYRGSDKIDVLTVFLEPGKVKRFADKHIYQIAAHVLPGRCEELSGNPDVALEFRNQLRSQGQAAVSQAGFKLPKPALGGVVAAILGAGAAAAQANPGGGEDLSGQNLKGEQYPISLGVLPMYAQFSSAVMLGRTITSYRNFEEASLWNPSLLVHAPGNYVRAAGGVRNEWRGAGSWQIPWRAESVPFYAPRVVTAGFFGLYWDRDEDQSTPGIREDVVRREIEERMISVGLGFAFSEDVAFGLNAHNYHQRFGTVETVQETGSPQEVFDNRTHDDANDIDLGITWDATEELRLAASIYNLAGTEALDADSNEVPLSRGVIGASVIRDRFSAGAEVGLNPGDMNLAAGVNYRVHRLLAIDLSGATRWQTVQAGLDVTPGPVTGTFRIRWDDREDAAVHLGVGIGW